MLRVSWPEYFEWCLSEDKVVEKLLKKIKIKTNIIGGIIVSLSCFYFLQNLMTKIHASKHELKIFLARELQNNRPQNFVSPH